MRISAKSRAGAPTQQRRRTTGDAERRWQSMASAAGDGDDDSRPSSENIVHRDPDRDDDGNTDS